MEQVQERVSMQDVQARMSHLLTTEERIQFYTERNQELDELEGFWKQILEVYQINAHAHGVTL